MMARLSESVYGPFLRFEKYTPPLPFGVDSSWEGSLLYICREDKTSAVPPTCLTADESTAEILDGRLLDVYENYQFWRFDLKFALSDSQREIFYQLCLNRELQEQWSFYIPSATQVWRWSAYSCSGFSHDVIESDWMVDNDHPMVMHLLRRHREKPLHFNFGGGDQLYNDGVFHQPKIGEWLKKKNREERHTQVFTDELKNEAEDYFFAHYCEHFQTKSLKEMVASIPNVMLWDDHDIFDGWGSYPEDMRTAPVFHGIFLVARKFYLLFQQHTTVELVEDGKSDLFGNNPTKSPSFSFLKLAGPTMALLGVDIRSERTKQQVLSEDSWSMVFAKVRELPPSVRHLIVNFTVPIVYPRVPISEALLELVSNMTRISALNALLVKTNILSSLMKLEFGEPELLDDLVDHWTGHHHSEERKRVVENFQQLARERHLRVTFLSGDVHCAALGRFYSHPKVADLAMDPFFMPQIITSAIINPPPPPVAIRLMHTCDYAANRINSKTREKMVRFFKDKYPREDKVLSKRNFLVVDEHPDGCLKASIFVEEDRLHMTKDPFLFEVFIPELKTTFATDTTTASHDKKIPQRRSPRTLSKSPPISPRGSRDLDML